MDANPSDGLPSWALEAAKLPVAFAQVREDPLIDALVVDRLGDNARIIMVASGGCTLAYLAANCRAASIDVVDPNPAQIALARLKLHLLVNFTQGDRMTLLGHAPAPVNERQHQLEKVLQTLGLRIDAIGPANIWSLVGPDYAGRYEQAFASLQKQLAPFSTEMQALLSLSDPAEQSRRVDSTTILGKALDEAFDQTMDLPILVRLFGEGATRNRVEPFARHFARRTRHVLATSSANVNPYLWQVLVGRYPPGVAAPWLSASAPTALPAMSWHNCLMTEALRRAPGCFDFVHLSNILDWLDPEEARVTLDLAHAALRPGGWTLIRQLNSTLDIPSVGSGFDWRTDEAQALLAFDRSYFYRALHLGKKR